MNFLNLEEAASHINTPKYTEVSFILRNNYYVVTDGNVYNYYPILTSASSDTDPLIRFEKLPPVLLEGYALVEKKIYLVTLKDLQRKIIRKLRETKPGTFNEIRITNQTSSTAIANTDGSAAIQSGEQQGTSYPFEMEISQAADVAWKEQIGALFNNPAQEEEYWEVEDNSQSG